MSTSYVYTLTFSDPTNTDVIEILGTTVGSGKNNYSTSLDLVGSGYVNYGKDIAQNFVKVLENFAGPNPPINSIKGQIWYDTSNPARSVLRVNNGEVTSNRWPAASGIYQQTNNPILSYSQGVTSGDIWVNTDRNQLSIWSSDINDWVIVGPIVAGNGSTKSGSEAVSVQTNRNDGSSSTVILNWIDGKVVEIISAENFTPRSVIEGFTSLKQGTNLTSRIPARYNGIAESAAGLYVSPSVTIKSTDVLKNKSPLTPQIHTGTFIVETSAAVNGGLRIRNPDVTGGTIQIHNLPGQGAVVDYLKTDSSLRVGVSTSSFIKFDGSSKSVSINTSTANGTFYVYGSGNFSSDVGIVGSLSVTGTAAFNNLVNVSRLTVSNISTFSGGISLGSNSGSGPIITPATSDTYDLGTAAKPFRQLFVSAIGSTNSNITIYGRVSTATQLELAQSFSIQGHIASVTPVSFNGTAPVILVTTATASLITATSITTATTATQSLLVVNTASVTPELKQISKADFLSDIYALVFQPGMIIPFGSTSTSGTPSVIGFNDGDWLWCNGGTTSTVAHPVLATILGDQYGSAPAGLFKLPNLTTATNANGYAIQYIIKT
jgi:hypothetical protein